MVIEPIAGHPDTHMDASAPLVTGSFQTLPKSQKSQPELPAIVFIKHRRILPSERLRFEVPLKGPTCWAGQSFDTDLHES